MLIRLVMWPMGLWSISTIIDNVFRGVSVILLNIASVCMKTTAVLYFLGGLHGNPSLRSWTARASRTSL